MIGFQVKRTILIGLKSLWLHRLRSFLTILGMICGVCAVIAMLAIGEGASFEAQEQIRQLGSTNISILAVKPPEDAAQAASSSGGPGLPLVQYGLTYDDAERIASTFPDVRVTVPVQKVPKTVWSGALHVDATVMGTVPWYTGIRNRRLTEGRFITTADMHDSKNVCVVEPAIVEALFPGGNALGKTIKVGLNYYRVVGIIEGSAAAAAGGEGGGAGGGPGVYMPATTVRMTFGELNVQRSAGSMSRERVELHEIIVNVPSVDKVIPMAENLRVMLKGSHPKHDYKLDVPFERLQAAEKIKRTFNVVLGSIAAISLLVGGIGIMNIMLASVTERTREIGIRRALGAKKKHIITQFLTETVLLSGVGGILGVAIGVIIPAVVEHFAAMKTIVTLWSPLVAFSISAFVGVVFGIYPAYRAANMDPIEALRHE